MICNSSVFFLFFGCIYLAVLNADFFDSIYMTVLNADV